MSDPLTALVHNLLAGHSLVLGVARGDQGSNQLQHEVNVGDFLRRPSNLFVLSGCVIQFKEWRETLNVAALLKEVLIGRVVLEKAE